MARGRMLNKMVCASLKFHDLPDDTCRLLATWIIPHLDKNGVFYADPAMVKSYVFPRRADITTEQVQEYLDCLVYAGLVVFFEAKGDTWQHWPGFMDNQVGLRADRETTDFPQPPEAMPETIRQDAGKMPEPIPPNRSEVKGSEVKGMETEIPTSSVADATPVKPDTKPDTKPKGTTRTTKSKKPLTESQQMFTALAEICAIDLRTLTEGQRGQLNQSEKILRDAGATPEQMPGFRAWWDRDDWRGKKGEPPEPYQVRAEWGRYLESLKAARSPASVAVRVYT